MWDTGLQDWAGHHVLHYNAVNALFSTSNHLSVIIPKYNLKASQVRLNTPPSSYQQLCHDKFVRGKSPYLNHA